MEAPMGSSKIQAEPHAFDFDVKSTALVMIDMKRRFVEPAGLNG
jgi:hypothetical protein